MAALTLSKSTFYEWKRLYQERGVDGLTVQPIPGGTPKLTDKQTSQLWRWIVGRDPRQFQFDFALWTRKIVGDLIRQKFDVEMTPARDREAAAPNRAVAAATALPRLSAGPREGAPVAGGGLPRYPGAGPRGGR